MIRKLTFLGRGFNSLSTKISCQNWRVNTTNSGSPFVVTKHHLRRWLFAYVLILLLYYRREFTCLLFGLLLYYIRLYYILLSFIIILYYIILYYIILYYIILYYIILYYIILYYIIY